MSVKLTEEQSKTLKRLYIDNRKKIVAVIRSVIKFLNDDALDACLAITFRKACESFAKAPPSIPTAPWLLIIARNSAQSYLESKGSEREALIALDEALGLFANCESGERKRGILYNTWEEEKLWTVIASRLSQNQKAVFILLTVSRLSKKEISDLMNMAEEALKEELRYIKLKTEEVFERRDASSDLKAGGSCSDPFAGTK